MEPREPSRSECNLTIRYLHCLPINTYTIFESNDKLTNLFFVIQITLSANNTKIILSCGGKQYFVSKK